jgi:hypothetical protein
LNVFSQGLWLDQSSNQELIKSNIRIRHTNIHSTCFEWKYNWHHDFSSLHATVVAARGIHSHSSSVFTAFPCPFVVISHMSWLKNNNNNNSSYKSVSLPFYTQRKLFYFLCPFFSHYPCQNAYRIKGLLNQIAILF